MGQPGMALFWTDTKEDPVMGKVLNSSLGCSAHEINADQDPKGCKEGE